MRHRGNEWRKDNLQQIVMQQVNIHTQKMEFDESHTIYKKKKLQINHRCKFKTENNTTSKPLEHRRFL